MTATAEDFSVFFFDSLIMGRYRNDAQMYNALVALVSIEEYPSDVDRLFDDLEIARRSQNTFLTAEHTIIRRHEKRTRYRTFYANTRDDHR